MWPRFHAQEAFEIWKDQDRQAAIDYLKANCPEDWRKLAWQHVINLVGLERSKYENGVQ